MGDGTNPQPTVRNQKVNELADVLIGVWNEQEPDRPVTASYVATFADLAEAAVAWFERDSTTGRDTDG